MALTTPLWKSLNLGAPANDNFTQLSLPQDNNTISGIWATDRGLLNVLDGSGEVFQVDPVTQTITQLQAQTPNGDIWSPEADDIGSVGRV